MKVQSLSLEVILELLRERALPNKVPLCGPHCRRSSRGASGHSTRRLAGNHLLLIHAGILNAPDHAQAHAVKAAT
jgi:hypothetical protein